MLFFCIAYFLLCHFFPISFDNNDDQGMFFINAGIQSGIPSSTILFINTIIGFFLKTLFNYSAAINWYYLFLQFVQFISILTICYFIIRHKNVRVLDAVFLMLFMLFGVFALSVVKIQFTTVSLLACSAALISLQNKQIKKYFPALCIFFVTLSILIRKDSFYIFIFFVTPILVFNFLNKKTTHYYISVLFFSVVLFIVLNTINDFHPSYQRAETYKYLTAIDDIVDKPTSYNSKTLEEFNLTEADIVLMKARFPGHKPYNIGKTVFPVTKKIKSTRTFAQLKTEFIKFVKDERYILFIYLLSLLVVLVTVPKYRYLALLNASALFALIFYLALSIRIPHRVTFPVIIYVSIVNIILFVKFYKNRYYKTLIICVFFLIGCVKFYFTSKLFIIQQTNHQLFISYQKEIDIHPDVLFISLYDGFPVQYMNALTAPDQLNQKGNLILTGWNIWSPDFNLVLRRHQLQNLFVDLKGKKQVLFLTDMEDFMNAYVSVMKSRYNLNCHFERVFEGYKILKPKRLVFDN